MKRYHFSLIPWMTILVFSLVSLASFYAEAQNTETKPQNRHLRANPPQLGFSHRSSQGSSMGSASLKSSQANVVSQVEPDGTGSITFTAKGTLPEPAFIYSVDSSSKIEVQPESVTQLTTIDLTVIQGELKKNKPFTLEIKGEGKITSVTGNGIQSWSVRKSLTDHRRFLDIQPEVPVITAPIQQSSPAIPFDTLKESENTKSSQKSEEKKFHFEVRSEQKIESLPCDTQVLTFAQGDAMNLHAVIHLSMKNVHASISKISGLLPLKEDWAFVSSENPSLSLKLIASAGASERVELINPRLTGEVDTSQKSTTFLFTATVKVRHPKGGILPLLTGEAGIKSLPSDAAYALKLRKINGKLTYTLEFPKPGEFPVKLSIIASVKEHQSQWKGYKVIDFTSPQGVIFPIQLNGLSNVTFSDTQPVLLQHYRKSWRGFLPANGHCFIAWKKGRKATDGKLAFTSQGISQVSVGSGLLRQTSTIQLRVLQGKIKELTLRMQGQGEVLDVQGSHIAGWSVVSSPSKKGNERLLKINLSLPIKKSARITVLSQQALGEFPVTATPLRLTPRGVLRHSGYVKAVSKGAVRLETVGVRGMMQLSPNQFPSSNLDQTHKRRHASSPNAPSSKNQQVFVFRYPSSDFSWALRADQILPVVSINQIVTYRQTESDRIISTQAELDIREAPLREWVFRIPRGYAVASLTGAEVSDYVLSALETKTNHQKTTGKTSKRDANRVLMQEIKVLFKRPVTGRQLVQIQLEKNTPPTAGTWKLPPLEFPHVKSVRGHVGIATSRGWMVVPLSVKNLSETPLSYFPIKDKDLQQAYRLRESDWSANMSIQARKQSVQADVFHLYSLKEGMTYGSVLLNYFVVGAPVNEWKISVPSSYENLNVDGQNVRQWRRVKSNSPSKPDTIIVQLDEPVSGATTLLVTFSNTMDSQGGTIQLGEVSPLNVQNESGFIEVVSSSLLKHTIRTSSPALLKVSHQEIPAEFRMLTTAPSQAAWQYVARPFSLSIDVAWYAPGKTIEQIIDFATLKSNVSRDGQVKTEARFFIRTRGRQALRMKLPDGAKLWEATANGASMNARIDNGEYLLPLPVSTNPNSPVEVVIRYGVSSDVSGSKKSRITLGAPVFKAPMIISTWTITPEKGQLLVPDEEQSQGVTLDAPILIETGIQNLQSPCVRWRFFIVMALITLSLFVSRLRKSIKSLPLLPSFLMKLIPSIGYIGALGIVIGNVIGLWDGRGKNLSEVKVFSQIVTPDTPLTLTVNQSSSLLAMISWWGIVAIVLGVAVLLAGILNRRFSSFITRAVASIAISAGILAQCNGGAFFMALLIVVVGFLLFREFINNLSSWEDNRRKKMILKEKKQAEIDEVVSLGAPMSGSSTSSSTSSTVSLLMVILSMVFAMSPSRVEAQSESQQPLVTQANNIDSLVQRWDIKKNHLVAEVNITVFAKVGVTYTFLKSPAILTSFKSDALVVKKVKTRDGNAWVISSSVNGKVSATASYEMALPRAIDATSRGRHQSSASSTNAKPATQQQTSFFLPTGQASVQSISATIDDPGLEIFSESAVQTIRTRQASSGDVKKSKWVTQLTLSPHSTIKVSLQAKGRDIQAEKTKFYAEISNLYLPSPGVVDGFHRVSIRPSSGMVSHLKLSIPAGFTVGDVKGDHIDSWQFDPASRQLHVDIQPGQSRLFAFHIFTQSGLSPLPSKIDLSSVSISGDAGETNILGIAFGSDAQAGKITTNHLSQVNVDDFDKSLIPHIVNERNDVVSRGSIHKVYRSTSGKGGLSLQVVPVMPEVRVVSHQEMTLSSEHILFSSSLNVNITRSGIFKLTFPLPRGFEVVSISGKSLSHWSVSEADQKGESGNKNNVAQRVVTLHLNGRTMGKQVFSITLAEEPNSHQLAALKTHQTWQVPGIQINEAIRQSGQLIIIPEKGIRIRAVDRHHVSRLNLNENSTLNTQVKSHGGLAFRILQSDWRLSLGIEKLNAWITGSALQEVSIREGQTRTRISAVYLIEHAAVKSMKVILPGLTPEEARTVRVSGPLVKGIFPLSSHGATRKKGKATTTQKASDLSPQSQWEVQFRRGILGKVTFYIEYQRGADRQLSNTERLRPVRFPDVKRFNHFLAVRSSDRLDLQVVTASESNVSSKGSSKVVARHAGWKKCDWSAVPRLLWNPSNTSVPTLCFRLNETDSSVTLSIKRHEMAKTLQLRVTHNQMTTVIAPQGNSLTELNLSAQVKEKTRLRITLPPHSKLYSVSVNDTPVSIVKEGDSHLFLVTPNNASDHSARIALVYANTSDERHIHLLAPSFDIPIESVTWDVLVPHGYQLISHDGGFELRGSQGWEDYSLSDYQEIIHNQQSQEARRGLQSLKMASYYMRNGKQKEAVEELEKVTKNRSIDPASNEDARTQLYKFQWQQAAWGLNTRRQRIYLDHKAAGVHQVGNAVFEDSALNNPLFKGKKNFDVRQVDDFLRGNSLEEKNALKRIAQQIIRQQLATEVAPQMIQTIVKGRGKVFRFTRGIQMSETSLTSTPSSVHKETSNGKNVSKTTATSKEASEEPRPSSLSLDLTIESTSKLHYTWIVIFLVLTGLIGAYLKGKN